MGSEGLSLVLSPASGFFLSFCGIQLSFLFFCILSISVSQSYSFQSRRHGNVWYSLARDRSALFKAEKTVDEGKKSIFPFAWSGWVLTTHGFQCYSESLDSLWLIPVWVSYRPRTLVSCGVHAERLPDTSSNKGIHIWMFSACRTRRLGGNWSTT